MPDLQVSLIRLCGALRRMPQARAVAALLTLVVALSLAALAGERQSPKGQESVARAKQELLAADRAFAQATRERGLDGWMTAFNEQSTVNLTGEPVRGTESLRKFYSGLFASQGLVFEFHPTSAGVVNEKRPDDLGYTLGDYKITTTGADGKPQSRSGSYITIWKKQPDGAWKVLTDLGSANPAPKPVQ